MCDNRNIWRYRFGKCVTLYTILWFCICRPFEMAFSTHISVNIDLRALFQLTFTHRLCAIVINNSLDCAVQTHKINVTSHC